MKALRFRKTIKDDCVTDAITVNKENEIIIATKSGTVCRQKIEKISTQRRESQGVSIVKVDDKDEVMAISQVIEDDELEASKADKKQSTDKNTSTDNSTDVVEQTTLIS